jgi:hypothetical protein
MKKFHRSAKLLCLLAAHVSWPMLSVGQDAASARSTDPADFVRVIEISLHGKGHFIWM